MLWPSPSERMLQDPRYLSRLNALLGEGLDLEPGGREAWLASLQGADGEMVPRLRELFARADAGADTFMRGSAAEALPDGAFGPVETDRPGDRVGPYVLIEPLGAGGMSTVWRAERRDRSVAREVALKLPREGWGPGLAQRMARERNILASLEHPLIARLYDAGQTADGRPWFAMEQVRGVPIDEHCRRAALDVRACLTLFLQVLDAVAYAHARLVVHRDLKPGNILVDDSGRVRLLDFGVAKLLDEDERSAAQALTRLHGRPMTLPYASPEQLTHGPITVASDVYALGVVLFELLTGAGPYPGDRQARAQLEAAILDEERRTASQAARDRRRARQLRGDVDAILAKAVHRDVKHRYASVESFAADLRRHLAGEPVLAQRLSRSYLALKFVLRHRFGLGAASAVAFATICGLGVALWQADAARRQAELAQTRLRQAEGLLRFTNSVLTNQLRADETITLRELLRRAEDLMERTMDDRPLERALAAEVLASWQGTLGDVRQSIHVARTAIARLPPGADPALLERLRCRLAMSLSLAGESDAALSLLDEALRSPSGDPSSRLSCELPRANVLRNLNRADEAMFWARAARQTLTRIPDVPPSRRAAVEVELGFALVISGQPSQAVARFDDALRLLASDPDVPPAQTTFTTMNRAIALIAAGQPARALADLEAAVEFSRRRSPSGHAPPAILVNLANALRVCGRLDEAEQAFRDALDGARRDNYPVMQAGGVGGLAAVALDRRDAAAAKPHLDASIALVKELQLPPESPIGGNTRIMQARWGLLSGDAEQADRALAELVRGFAVGKPASAAGLLTLRAEAARLRGDLDAATRLLDEALVQARAAQGDFPTSATAAQVLVAQAEVQALRGNAARAVELAQQALRHAETSGGPQHPAIAPARRLLQGRGAP